MAGPRVGWVLGFGSLVHPDDPLVRRLALAGLAVPGAVAGMRRTWTAGLVNRAREHDAKHHLDPDGSRPDVVVAALSADDVGGVRAGPTGAPGGARGDVGASVPSMNVLALPVDADGLARTDARERGYERLEVSGRFVAEAGEGVARGAGPAPDAGSTEAVPPAPLGGPVWIYTATARSRQDVAQAAVEGRAVVSRAYVDLVEAAFRARGPAAWEAYRASTDVPPHPLRELVLHRPGVLPGE